MRIRRIIALIAIGFSLGAAAIAAYLGGMWIPNFPAKATFPIRGIDVSRHQGIIQWRLILPNEVHFVYIKATEGGDFRDAQFTDNWKASADAGFRRGAYHFFTFKTPGLRQAANFIAVVPNEPGALPPAIDLEFWGNSPDRPSVGDFRRELSIFMSAVRSFYDREPVLYTDMDFKNYYLRDLPIQRLWIRSVITAPRIGKGEDWRFWQFTEKMRIQGIQGFVDHNVFNGHREEFESFISQRN
jgi:lysozyme